MCSFAKDSPGCFTVRPALESLFSKLKQSSGPKSSSNRQVTRTLLHTLHRILPIRWGQENQLYWSCKDSCVKISGFMYCTSIFRVAAPNLTRSALLALHSAPVCRWRQVVSHSMSTRSTLESLTALGDAELVQCERTAPVFREVAHPDRRGGAARPGSRAVPRRHAA